MPIIKDVYVVDNNSDRKRYFFAFLTGIVTGFCVHMLYNYSVTISFFQASAMMKFESAGNGGFFKFNTNRSKNQNEHLVA